MRAVGVFVIECGKRRAITNKNNIRFSLDEACEAKNLLHEYAGALQRESHHEGNTIKRVGLEKMSEELMVLSRLIQQKVDAMSLTREEKVHSQVS